MISDKSCAAGIVLFGILLISTGLATFILAVGGPTAFTDSLARAGTLGYCAISLPVFAILALVYSLFIIWRGA